MPRRVKSLRAPDGRIQHRNVIARGRMGVWCTQEGGDLRIQGAPVALVRQHQAIGAHGGSSVSANWNTRALNAIAYDQIGIVSLSAGRVTLPPGTYGFRGQAMGVDCGNTRCAVVDVSTGTPSGLEIGQNFYCDISQTYISVNPTVLLPFYTWEDLNPAVELWQWTKMAVATYGLGLASNCGWLEHYAELYIWRLE